MKARIIITLTALFTLTALTGCEWFIDPDSYYEDWEDEVALEPDADAAGACYWYDTTYNEYFCTCTTYAACKDTCDMFGDATACELDEGAVCPSHFDFTWCD